MTVTTGSRLLVGLCVAVAVAGIAFTGGAAADESTLEAMDGEGTADDPYVITDADELQAMAADVDAHYVLGADIDASEAVTIEPEPTAQVTLTVNGTEPGEATYTIATGDDETTATVTIAASDGSDGLSGFGAFGAAIAVAAAPVSLGIRRRRHRSGR